MITDESPHVHDDDRGKGIMGIFKPVYQIDPKKLEEVIEEPIPPVEDPLPHHGDSYHRGDVGQEIGQSVKRAQFEATIEQRGQTKGQSQSNGNANPYINGRLLYRLKEEPVAKEKEIKILKTDILFVKGDSIFVGIDFEKA